MSMITLVNANSGVFVFDLFFSSILTHTISLREMSSSSWFFFSSRRRHTRSLCDWSSDVCSSDLSTRRRIGDAMARWPAARRFVRRFVAGEGAEDALRVIARLNAQGLLCAVTYLGENVVTAADAAQAGRAYVELLGEIERRRLAAVPSLKLTHLGLDLGEAVCRANLEAVLARGRASATLVWIDMASTAYTERTLDLYAHVRPASPNAACVVQAYLRRTAQDLERLIEVGAAVRLWN